MSNDIVEIYTDGSHRTKDGDAIGWGFWTRLEEGNIWEACGPSDGSSNRGELTAAIRAVNFAIKHDLQVILRPDSQYVIKGTNDQLSKWQSNGWKRADGQQIKNIDLWKEMALAVDTYQSAYGYRPVLKYVKAHVGIEGNENADRMANMGGTRMLAGQGDIYVNRNEDGSIRGGDDDAAESIESEPLATSALFVGQRMIGIINSEQTEPATGYRIYHMFTPNETEAKEKKDRSIGVPNANSFNATVLLKDESPLAEWMHDQFCAMRDDDVELPYVIRWDSVTAKKNIEIINKSRDIDVMTRGYALSMNNGERFVDLGELKRDPRMIFLFTDKASRRVSLIGEAKNGSKHTKTVDITENFLKKTETKIHKAVLPKSWKADKNYYHEDTVERNGIIFMCNETFVEEGSKASESFSPVITKENGWKYGIKNELAQMRFMDVDVPGTNKKARLTLGKDLPMRTQLSQILETDINMSVKVVFYEYTRETVRFTILIETKEGYLVCDNPYSNFVLLDR